MYDKASQSVGLLIGSKFFYFIFFLSLSFLGCEMKVQVTKMGSEVESDSDVFLRDGGTLVRRNGAEVKINAEDLAHREVLPNGAEISVMINTNGAIVR